MKINKLDFLLIGSFLESACKTDSFYWESNIRYLEDIMQEVKESKAYFIENGLIEMDE